MPLRRVRRADHRASAGALLKAVGCTALAVRHNPAPPHRYRAELDAVALLLFVLLLRFGLLLLLVLLLLPLPADNSSGRQQTSGQGVCVRAQRCKVLEGNVRRVAGTTREEALRAESWQAVTGPVGRGGATPGPSFAFCPWTFCSASSYRRYCCYCCCRCCCRCRMSCSSCCCRSFLSHWNCCRPASCGRMGTKDVTHCEWHINLLTRRSARPFDWAPEIEESCSHLFLAVLAAGSSSADRFFFFSEPMEQDRSQHDKWQRNGGRKLVSWPRVQGINQADCGSVLLSRSHASRASAQRRSQKRPSGHLSPPLPRNCRANCRAHKKLVVCTSIVACGS